MSIGAGRESIAAAFLLTVSTGAAVAVPITVTDPLQSKQSSFRSGDFVRHGASSVVPNGPNGGTTGSPMG